MYNRYVPQSDGTFRKSRIPDPPKAAPRKPSPPPNPREKTGFSQPLCKPGARPPMTYRRRPSRPEPYLTKPESIPEKNESFEHAKDGGIVSFLRQLLPKGLCTEDMIVILLLLLMCGDNEESKNNALLTLVIYLFL